MQTYCESCRKDTVNKTAIVFRTKNGRLMLKSVSVSMLKINVKVQCVEIKNLDLFQRIKVQVFHQV